MSKIYTVIAAGGLGKRLKDYRGNKSTKMLLKIKNEAMITNQINQLLKSDFYLQILLMLLNSKY